MINTEKKYMGVYQYFTGKRSPILTTALGQQKGIVGLGKDLEYSCFPSSPLFPFPLSPCVVIFCCLDHSCEPFSAFGPFSLAADEFS